MTQSASALAGWPPELAFLALLAALVGWMTLPLLPALLELYFPKDASPLDAVGNDAGNLTFFAESFTRRVTQEGLLGTMVPPRLSDGSTVRTHSQGQPLVKQRRPVNDFVVLLDTEPLPDGIELGSECLARLTVRGGTGCTYRALLGQRDVVLGPNSTVLRWVHARGRLEVGEGSKLLGRATAERSIVLAPNVSFDRLESDVIRVAGVEDTVEAPTLPTGAYQRFVPEKRARSMGPAYWRVEDNLLVPSGAALVGSVIATGAIVVDDGARVTGSIKAHHDVRICSGAVVVGAISARGRITIERGAKVSGPIVSESAIVIEAAVVRSKDARTTVAAPIVRLLPGATIYGAVMAGDDGQTIA
jgi:predicted acyltransferase (DUF342 family)